MRDMAFDVQKTGIALDTIGGGYEEIPYPNVPIDASPENNDYTLFDFFRNSLVTAQYVRTRQIISSEGKTLLNVGCGSGWETLLMAEANPGARKIVGIDLSPRSVKVAEQRLRLHGYTNVEFYAMDLLNVGQLNESFDLIACRDVIYLLDSQVDALKAMQGVLKPDGILASGLHCYYQRYRYLGMQQFFKILGLSELPSSESNKLARSLVNSLRPEAHEVIGWGPNLNTDDQALMNNHLLWGDKGFSALQMMDFLHQSGLDLVSMVNSPTWDLTKFFTTVPDWVEAKLDELSRAEILHLVELLAPPDRLLDFWAEHKGSSLLFPWSDEDWQVGVIHLNPILMYGSKWPDRIEEAIKQKQPCQFPWTAKYGTRLTIPEDKLKWLSLLLEGPRTVDELADYALSLDKKADPEELREDVLVNLQALEDYAFVLLGPSN